MAHIDISCVSSLSTGPFVVTTFTVHQVSHASGTVIATWERKYALGNGAAPDMLLLGERFSLLSSRCILLAADETRRVEYMVHLDKPAM